MKEKFEAEKQSQNLYDYFDRNLTLLPSQNEESIPFMKTNLKKGCYDINYVINLLKIIEEKCESLKMHPKDGIFTIKDSVTKLRAMLEIEKIQ